MNHFISAVVLLAVIPSAASAQIDIIFSGTRPVVRANVGGVMVSATPGPRGLDLRVGERATVTAGGRTPRASTSGGRSRRTSTSSGRTGRASAGAVLATADSYVGTRYQWGGATPAGFDCSGFVQYVFRRHGIELPRTSRQQAAAGEYVPLSLASLRVGDLMFFATNGTRIDHIAIYAGNNEILHSSSSGGGVGYDSFSSKRGRWFTDHHVATRRVIGEGEDFVGNLSAALRALVEFDPPDRAPRR